MSKDVRWKQRFQNFRKALQLLQETFAISLLSPILEKEDRRIENSPREL